MKKIIAMSTAVALLAGTSLAYADSKVETKCKNMGTKNNISANKMDDYVKTCVKKHTMKHKMSKKAAEIPCCRDISPNSEQPAK